MKTVNEHICVCICTYKRPLLLDKLLHELQEQITNEIFSYSVVIVDNDNLRSAESTVKVIASNSHLNIKYYCQQEKNISLARNKAIEMSTGEYLVFIDDDEFPVKDWLLRLYNSCRKYKADGVLGPVKPYYEVTPPKWILKGKLLERSSFPTGTILTKTNDTRTGNVLFKKSLFNDKDNHFDARYGLTGGEDTDLFRRLLAMGKTFVWCDEACAYETVPPNRFKRTYFLKRALLRGIVAANTTSIILTLKSLVAVFIYSAALPFILLAGQHLFMKYLIKNCDHIGRLLGTVNILPIKERNY